MAQVVDVAVIHHRHGEDIFIGENRAAVNREVEQYCREWVRDFGSEEDGVFDENGELLLSGADLVARYFELAGESEYVEYLRLDVAPASPEVTRK